MKRNTVGVAILGLLIAGAAYAAPTTRRALPASTKATTKPTSRPVTLEEIDKAIPKEFKTAMADDRGVTTLMEQRINEWLKDHYVGQQLIYSGVVSSISGGDSLTVQLHEPENYNTLEIACKFPKSDSAKLSNVHKGDKMKVIGKINRLRMEWLETSRVYREVKITLDDCKQP